MKLKDVKKRLDDYVYNGSSKLSFDNPNDTEMVKALRNKYFHFSAHYNDLIAGMIPAMAPNREKGIRTRKTLDG